MTADDCEELRRVVNSPAGLRSIPNSFAWAKSVQGVEGCLAEELQRCVESQDWLRFERYVVTATEHPDQRYVDTLCAVLQRPEVHVSFDDIVVALGEIADPRSVPHLVDAMWWTPEWGEYLQLAKKCVWALGRIGTTEALEALRDAASVGSDVVREEATDELNRRS